MTFTALALAIGTVFGFVRGGRLRYIADHQVRGWWLVMAGFGLQIVPDRVDLGGLGTPMLLVGYGCLLVFAAMNWRLVGMGVAFVGLAANALVIGLNDGMPVRPSAVVAAKISDRAGLERINYGRRHHEERPTDRLTDLGDIIPVSQLHEVVSFGDLILAVGVADVASNLLRPRRRRRGKASKEKAPDDPPQGQVTIVTEGTSGPIRPDRPVSPPEADERPAQSEATG
ncbi:MAG TPA: DUF5317 family protein [Acidimicrobiales bacterium]